MSASAASSVSAACVVLPTDRRTAPLARAASMPIAASTPLTASCSVWQADPTDAATLSATWASTQRPLTPGKDTCSVFGSRSSG